jgi:hypothetical protein
MANPSIFDFTDFRGGFFTDVPTDLMKDNELLQADNCYWRNGLQKRLGQASFTSYSGSGIRGGFRVFMSSLWYTILGVENSATGTVELMIGTDNASTTIPALSGFTGSLTHTASGAILRWGQNIAFAVLDEKVVAVNGYDKPKIIWASGSSFMAQNLEEYDKRAMTNDDWNAGQYYPALSATSYFTDTTDAQSASTADFAVAGLASQSITSGFWVGCAHTFNKVTAYNAAATNTATTLDVTYQYYGQASSGGATGWIGFTPVNIPTWTAAGNKEIELNFPIDSNTKSILMGVTPSLNSSIGGVYALKTIFSTTMSATFIAHFNIPCDYLKVDHSQYLTQILTDDRPDTTETHKSHVFMGMGNWLHISPYGTVRGWRESDKAIFAEGGYLQAMVPHLDYLCLVFDDSIHGIYGNSWANWSEKLLVGNKGTISKRSVCVVNEEVYFVARDGIYGWNGTRLLKLSKHIKSFLDSITLTDSAACAVAGEYWVSFPTNGYTLIFDPDTLRLDDVGDGRMSFYKFGDYPVNQFLPYYGAADTGALKAYRNIGTPRTLILESGTYDTFTATIPISMSFRTRDMAFTNSQQNKIFRRLKMQVVQSSHSAGAVYTLIHYANNQGGQSSTSVNFTVATGTGVDTVFQGIPPGIDGYTYGIYLNHATAYNAKFLGFSVEVDKRKY